MHRLLMGRRQSLMAGTLGISFGMIWALSTWRFGIDLADEGFYWYGAQRVLNGEVPLRDFMAYDVARYYWAAAVMQLLGSDGLAAARAAAWSIYLPGVALACIIVIRGLPEDAKGSLAWILVLTVAFLTCFWVIVYYKVFDQLASLIVVGVCIWVMRRGSLSSFWISGLLIGLLAIMGRNHGVYGVVALSLASIVLGTWERSFSFVARALAAVFLGALIGFSPTVVMFLFLPGFGNAFMDSVFELFRLATTNLSLPVPWPWATSVSGLGYVVGLQTLSRGLLFLILPLPVIAAAFVILRRGPWTSIRRTLIGIGVSALPYLHYSFSRPDLVHLSYGILPLIVFCCVIAWYCTLGRVFLGVLVLLSMLALYDRQPYLHKDKMSELKVDGHVFFAGAGVVRTVELLRHAQRVAGVQGPLLAVPDMIGLHALERQIFPGWDIYPLFRRDRSVVEAQLLLLNSRPPRVVLWSNWALDGREDLRMSNLNPQLFRWVVQHCREVPPIRPAQRIKVYVDCAV